MSIWLWIAIAYVVVAYVTLLALHCVGWGTDCWAALLWPALLLLVAIFVFFEWIPRRVRGVIMRTPKATGVVEVSEAKP